MSRCPLVALELVDEASHSVLLCRLGPNGTVSGSRAPRVGAVSEPESAELLSVGCECAANCGDDVMVTAAEYAAAHREADYVLVRPAIPSRPGRAARELWAKPIAIP